MRTPALQVACHELSSKCNSGGGGTGADANASVATKSKRKRKRKSGRRGENLI
jgi:hypothetical protein